MMRRLFENTVVSAISYGIISLLGLFVVPVIVGTWGLAAFGLIVLARTFLPVGLLGVIDLGVSEISTQSVAKARGDRNWKRASQSITVALELAGIIGLCVAVLLVAGGKPIALLFRVDTAHLQGFSHILYATALCNLVIFPGLVAEGIIKGFEHYPIMRMLEVASSLVFFLGVLAASSAGAPFQWAAYAFLAGYVLRSVVVWFLAMRLCTAAGLPLGIRPDAQARREALAYARVLAQGKVLGALQLPVLPIMVGALFGPHAVGIYDILVRVPRFCKSILSIVNSALLPVSARLKHDRHDSELRRLGRAGLIILPALTVPPLVGAAIFSEPILRLWIGPQVTSHWPWMALMFAIPVASQYQSFGNSMMLAWPQKLAVLNRLLMLQLAVMIVATAAGIPHLQERAFILGQAIAWIAVLPLQMWVYGGELGVTRKWLMKVVLVQIGLMAPPALVCLAVSAGPRIGNVVELGAAICIWSASLWLAQYFLILDDRSRREIWRMANALVSFGRPASRSP